MTCKVLQTLPLIVAEVVCPITLTRFDPQKTCELLLSVGIMRDAIVQTGNP
jgi:hypothetical protein